MDGTKGTGKMKTIKTTNENLVIVKKVIEFLQLFLPGTLAKWVIAIILLIARVPVPRVTELSGLCYRRSTRGLLKFMLEEETENLLAIKRGSDPKNKTSGIEAEILKEIEKNNYPARQQIADMIKEKFHVQISVLTVRRLKKRHQADAERLAACESRYEETVCIL